MATIELSPEEIAVLSEVIHHYLSDLRMEIADTDRQDFREGLKTRKETLMRIQSKLG